MVSSAGSHGGRRAPLRPIQALLTAFLGAFVTAKGVRTIQDYQYGESALELAGGASVEPDIVQGGVQLALFLLGAYLHRKSWTRLDSCGNECWAGACSSCCGIGCGCCCAGDDEERAVTAEAARVPAGRRGAGGGALGQPRRAGMNAML